MNMIDVFDYLVAMIVPLGICVVLPIVVVWLHYRKNQLDTEKRSEIIMAAIEKNGEIDVQDYFDKLTPPQKSLNDKLAMRLHLEILFGTILASFGVLTIAGCVVEILFLNMISNELFVVLICFGVIALAVGLGLIIAYFTGKKMLNTLDEE